MHCKFNKETLFNNIAFLLEKHGKKIGELESEVGVSTGYISRTSKDNITKPGIDFILATARVLGVSVDTLINVNLSKLASTELYLVSFFEKLKKDTMANRLDWNVDSADSLNRQIGEVDDYIDHGMINLETFHEEDENGYPCEVTRAIMVSKSFETNTYIDGDCFSLKMKNNTILYIMNICKAISSSSDPNRFAKEVWIYNPNNGQKFLSSNQQNSELSILVDDLYETISEFSKYPKLEGQIRNAIDAYMNNDDLEDDIPF